MKKLLVMLLVVSLLIGAGGCTTIMNGPTQEITITSNPPGAVITPTDYKCWIRTPGVIKLERTNSTILTARLFGYEDAKQEIKWEISPWIFGNACLYFTILDLSTGSVGNLSPTTIHFDLVPKK